MDCKIMILPSQDVDKIRVLKIPADMERQEAYRYATGVIAEAEADSSGCNWEDTEDALDEHGFETIDYVMGPALD